MIQIEYWHLLPEEFLKWWSLHAPLATPPRAEDVPYAFEELLEVVPQMQESLIENEETDDYFPYNWDAWKAAIHEAIKTREKSHRSIFDDWKPSW